MEQDFFEHSDYTNFSKLISLLMTESKDISNVLSIMSKKELDIVERINDRYKGFDRNGNQFSISPIGMKINYLGGIVSYIDHLDKEKLILDRKLKFKKYCKIALQLFLIILTIVGLRFAYLAIPKENEIDQSKGIQEYKETQKEKINPKLDSTLTTKPIQKGY